MLESYKPRHLKSLNKLFDTYYWFLYKKKFPFTEANLKLYIEDVSYCICEGVFDIKTNKTLMDYM